MMHAATSNRTSTAMPRQSGFHRLIRSSRALRRLPQLRSGQAFPSERVVARPMAPEAFEAFDRLLDRRNVSCRHPPHHEIRSIQLLKPFVTAAIDALVDGLPAVAVQRSDVLPYRRVDGHGRSAAVRAVRGRIAARSPQSPDETFGLVGNGVHPRQIVDKLRHARVVDLVAQASNIELSEMPRRLR